MALTEEFIEAVGNGKKTRVRIMLKDIMLVDPSLKTFNEMLTYAEKNLSDIYDEHDGEELISDSTEWDKDYMNQQMVAVVTNFSKERIALLEEIVKKLYAHKIQRETETTNSSPSGVQVAGGVIAVAGAGALIGGIAGSSVSVAIVGGVALAGGIAMVALGGNKEA